jgi:hypothetical protein
MLRRVRVLKDKLIKLHPARLLQYRPKAWPRFLLKATRTFAGDTSFTVYAQNVCQRGHTQRPTSQKGHTLTTTHRLQLSRNSHPLLPAPKRVPSAHITLQISTIYSRLHLSNQRPPLPDSLQRLP